MNDTQLDLPKSLLPPEPRTTAVVPIARIVTRAQRRRAERAIVRKLKQSGEQPQVLRLILFGQDAETFSKLYAEACRDNPTPPLKVDAALQVFRFGLATLAQIAEQQLARQNLVQIAPAGAEAVVAAQAKAVRPGGGVLLAGR